MGNRPQGDFGFSPGTNLAWICRFPHLGDTLYVSGVVVGWRDGEGMDIAALEAQVQRIQATLNAPGANFDEVVMLNASHVWQGPNFEGDRTALPEIQPGMENLHPLRIYTSSLTSPSKLFS